jgi:predicted HTH transcriptional regulator
MLIAKLGNTNMTKDEFENFLQNGESQDLEWKSDWPPGLNGGRGDPNWNKGRGELLKDLISLANSSGPSLAHLVVGVKDLGTHRKVLGINKLFDDADFQQWSTNTFDPPPKFLYELLRWKNKMDVGVFSIERIPMYPHVVKNDLGGILYKGQVWFRRGTQNNIALHSDLLAILKGEEPLKISRLNDPVLVEVKNHYKDIGREATLPLFERRDSLLAQGYEVATYPGTRREIWVGYHGNRYEHILLLKPKKKI